MRIIYGCANCSEEKYRQLNTSSVQPAQKYHRLLMIGLKKCGADVYCYSGLPINRNVTKKLFICEKDEVEDGVNYHYYKTINLPLFRQAMIYFGARRAVKRYKKEKDAIVICDCLNRANATGMASVANKSKIPVVMIVTDLPDYQFDQKTADKYNKLLSKADGYIFLTEQMNERVNKDGKPYIVLEGHSDDTLGEIADSERYEVKTGKKVIVYAGSIKKLYGIQTLVEGFLRANLPNAELQIFGDGDYREELEEICKTNPSVKYMGIRLNSEVVEVEQRSALLVNPRPTAPDYTKYSFPSKNMEYMVSGTPILTTKLPGMPPEYYPHVYAVEDESADGIARALNDVFKSDLAMRLQKGKEAREFVLNEKSNTVQAKKIIKFLEENF